MCEQRWKQLEMICSGQYPELPIVALGEMGLDRSEKNFVSSDIQENVFVRQLELSNTHDYPLVLHLRNAEEIGLNILTQAIPPMKKIHVHCFNSSLNVALDFFQRFPNSKLGFTPMIGYDNNERLRALVKRIPLTRILLESDAPFFPTERNHRYSVPTDVVFVAQQIGKIKGISTQLVLDANNMNAQFIYKKN